MSESGSLDDYMGNAAHHVLERLFQCLSAGCFSLANRYSTDGWIDLVRPAMITFNVLEMMRSTAAIAFI